MGVTYECPRCGYTTGKRYNIQMHLDRKRQCRAVIADVVPDVESCRHSDAPQSDAQSDAPHGNAQTTTVNNTTPVTTTTTGDHNTTNINTTTVYNISLSCSRELLPRGKEDLSHITDEMWTQLVRIALQNTDLAASILMHWIHFNPMVPQNHNVYVPPCHVSGMAAMYKTERTDRNKASWKWEPRREVLSEMLDDCMGGIDVFCNDHPELVSAKDARAVSSYLPAAERADQGYAPVMDELATHGSRLVELEQPDLARTCPDLPALGH